MIGEWRVLFFVGRGWGWERGREERRGGEEGKGEMGIEIEIEIEIRLGKEEVGVEWVEGRKRWRAMR
jgi:hypothetical protein